MLKESLTQFWLTDKQIDIFLLLYTYGPKPASTVAKMVWVERTNAYKMLESMIRQWLVAETSKQGTKRFYVPEKNVLRYAINVQREQVEKNEKLLPIIETELMKLENKRVSPMPKMHFFEGRDGITALFQDMYTSIKTHQYLMIKMFASNTLENQSASALNLRDYAKDFFDKIQKIGVHIDAYLGNGIMILENILQTQDVQELTGLPAWSSGVNVFVVGDVLYMIIFKDIPFGIKIESEELAGLFHFLLKKSVKS